MEKKKDGRVLKAHTPTAASKRVVQYLKAAGFTHLQIAEVLDISQPTLDKWYKEEIRCGKSKVESFCIGKLFSHISNNCKASLFFYMKTKMGWVENPNRETIPPPTVTIHFDRK